MHNVFLNTGNYLVHKQTYLSASIDVLESKMDPGPNDVLLINYYMACNGVTFWKHPLFHYEHRVHSESLWGTTNAQYEGFYKGTLLGMVSQAGTKAKAKAKIKKTNQNIYDFLQKPKYISLF